MARFFIRLVGIALLVEPQCNPDKPIYRHFKIKKVVSAKARFRRNRLSGYEEGGTKHPGTIAELGP